MPTYEYACTNPACGNRFELVQSFSAASATECPVCAQPVRKVFSAVGVVFKGSGFYRNDSRADADRKTKLGKSSAAASSSDSGESSSESKSTDDKSAGKSTDDKSAGTSTDGKSGGTSTDGKSGGKSPGSTPPSDSSPRDSSGGSSSASRSRAAAATAP
jgi:putative FmdB family regulatory protein